MLSTIRNRLIFIAGLVAISVFWLIPRDITIRVRDADGRMSDTTVRRIPLKQGLDLRGGIHLALELDESRGAIPNPEDAIDRALTVIRTRIDEFGVAEPDIRKVGTDRIVVELAGLSDPGRAKQIVARAAFLEFRITDMANQFGSALETIDQALIRAGITATVSGTGATTTPTAIDQLLTSDSEDDSTTTDGENQDSTSADTIPTFAVDQPGPLSSLMFFGQIPGEFMVAEEDVLRVDTLINHPATQRTMPRGLELAWASELTSTGGTCADLRVHLRPDRHLLLDRHLLVEGIQVLQLDPGTPGCQECGEKRAGGAAHGVGSELPVQRRRGFRAARTSSSRCTIVLWGAPVTFSGSRSASSAIRSIASTKLSRPASDSHSVGSIMRAPDTTSGK